ncbi:uncharacterized protein TNCV_2302041 [Trichonephila clavipes]|nr:uncharacterized protein TNCV_2302041 [Trichonephila clavipes]
MRACEQLRHFECDGIEGCVLVCDGFVGCVMCLSAWLPLRWIDGATSAAVLFARPRKDCERLRRNETTSTVSIGPNQIRPHNFAGELKNTQFKEALVKFFIDHWANDNMFPFIGNKTIYLSFDKCYSYLVVNNPVIGSIEESLSCVKNMKKLIFPVSPVRCLGRPRRGWDHVVRRANVFSANQLA